LNNIDFARVAAAYGLGELRAIDRASPRVWRTANATENFAFKIFDAVDAHAARFEANVIGHLDVPGEQRYRVQSLVLTSAGEALYESEDSAVLVTRWAAGASKPYTEIQRSEWHALGLSLAALHERLAIFGALPQRLGARLAARDVPKARSGVEADRSIICAKQPRWTERLSRYLDNQLELFDRHIKGASQPAPVPEQTIHNDYNQHNYLFDGIVPPRILDWDRAIAAPREYEVVRCLNHLPVVAPTNAAAFVAGYQSILRLNRAALRWALDVAMVEHAVKRWPVERWLSDLPDSEAQLDGVMRMVHVLASASADLETYFSSVGDP
jgi:Ser/Thr protein kinase RdoA (MazF antagonist)